MATSNRMTKVRGNGDRAKNTINTVMVGRAEAVLAAEAADAVVAVDADGKRGAV